MTHAGVSDAPPVRRPPQTIAVTAILAIFGLALVFQSSRWSRTPSYGNLLRIMSADVWGCIYFGVAVLMALALFLSTRRVLVITAHMLAFGLLAGWELGFIVRYFTDGATTIVNVVSWATYMCLVMWSAQALDRHPSA